MDRLIFLQGDTVRYIGSTTFVDDDGTPLNIRGKVGVVEARVANEERYVCDFGGHAFICHPNSLARQSFDGVDDRYAKHIERKWKTSDEKRAKRNTKETP